MLYLQDVGRNGLEAIPEAAWSEEPLNSKTRLFAQTLVDGVLSNQSRIDPLIKKVAENWELHRMATVDRCLLRLATYEILHEMDTPINVIINEAVEIAKRFSTSESSKFVNGILDKIKQERGHGPS